jgi:hypothetical protein
MAKVRTSKSTSKGQLQVPEIVKRSLRGAAGDRPLWKAAATGRIEVRKIGGRLSELVGLLGKPRRSATIAEMDRAVKNHFRNKQTRG